MKIGVTGSSGLIGSYFIKKYNHVYDFIEFLGDMTNFEEISEFVENDFDIVFHLASIIPKYDLNGIEIQQSFSPNIIGTRNIVKSVSKFNTKIIFTSTQKVYENKNELKINEKWRLNPKDEYGKSKLESEQIFHKFLNSDRFTILRISNIYGAIPERFSIIDTIAKSLVMNKKVSIGLSPKVLRDYLHVDDFLTALDLSIKHEGIFNICSGESYNIHDLINFFKIVSEKTPKITFGNHIPNNIVLDNTKAKNEIGFTPKYNIHTGIEKVLFDIKNYYKNK